MNDALIAELRRRVETIRYNLPGISDVEYRKRAEARMEAFAEVLRMLGVDDA